MNDETWDLRKGLTKKEILLVHVPNDLELMKGLRKKELRKGLTKKEILLVHLFPQNDLDLMLD